MLQSSETAEKKPRADEEHYRERGLCCHERATEVVGMPARDATTRLAQCAFDAGLPTGPRRNQAEQEAARERHGECKGDDRGIDGDVTDAR